MICAMLSYLVSEMLYGLLLPLFSNRQHYEIDDCREDNMEDYQNYHQSYICTVIMASSYNVRFRLFLCFMFHIRVFC